VHDYGVINILLNTSNANTVSAVITLNSLITFLTLITLWAYWPCWAFITTRPLYTGASGFSSSALLTGWACDFLVLTLLLLNLPFDALLLA